MASCELLLLLPLLLPFVFALSRLSGCSAAPMVVTAGDGPSSSACAESARHADDVSAPLARSGCV